MLVGLAALTFMIIMVTGLPSGSAERERFAHMLTVEGPISPATADHIERSIDRAGRAGAGLVVLRLDTPGGLDASMRAIIKAILGSPVPVATYVWPSGGRAASAGTYILYASHIAAMAPGTTLGAATPVQVGGLPFGREERDEEPRDASKNEVEDETEPALEPRDAMERKLIEDAAAYIRGLAELRGRNAEWAEQAVREAVSLSASEALKQNVVDVVARDVNDLLQQIDGRTVEVPAGEVVLDTADLVIEEIETDWRTEFLTIIANPNIALILMMIGIYGLIFEFSNPGAIVPGTVGAVSLLLALYALAILPVDYVGLALILLGLALMVAEAFTPAFGVLGIGGAASFVIGATMLFDADVPGMRISPWVIGAMTVTSGLLLAIVLRLAWRSHRRVVATGAEQMVGASGVVVAWAGKRGHVLAHGEHWQAVSDRLLAPGTRVRIERVDGLTLMVVPTEDWTAQRRK
jgi:membrane-bound serine protease (ClpP class)